MANITLDIEKFREKIRSSANINKAGMILIHNGIVRDSSRDGQRVSEIEVRVDWERLEQILQEARGVPGIVAVEAQIHEGKLKIGDDIMLLGVAGDIRENVISVLSKVLDMIKKEVTSKREF